MKRLLRLLEYVNSSVCNSVVTTLLTFTDKTGTDIVPNQGFHGRGSQKCWLGSVLNDSLKNMASIGRFICNLSNQNIPN